MRDDEANICIQKIQGVLLQSNMYIISQNEHIVIIDPNSDIELIDTSYIIDAILITHEHYDHIYGINKWRERSQCPVICGQFTQNGLRDSRINMSHYGTGLFEMNSLWTEEARVLGEISDYVCKADIILDDQDCFQWIGNRFQIIYTPGHSEGSYSYLLNDKNLFCGDTLLYDTPTGVHGRGSSRELYLEFTTPRLKELSDDIYIYPGHGNSFYLKEYSYWGEMV